MPADYTHTRCVNSCPAVFIRVGISIQKPVDSHLNKTRPAALQKWSCFIFNEQDLIVKLRASTLHADRRKLTASKLMGFILIAVMCLKQSVSFTTFVFVKSCGHISLKKISNLVVGKENSTNWDEAIYRRKVSLSLKFWECEWRRLYKTTTIVKLHIRKNLPYRRSLIEHHFLEGIKKGNQFGYVQCDIEVPENLKTNFLNFPPIFKNTLISKNDIGDLEKTYAKEEGIRSQPRKMLISSFTLQKEILSTPVLLFYLQLVLVVTKLYRFVEYTPKKCFNGFVQAAVDARRKGDENSISSVVAQTMNLLANSSYGYQNMDRNRTL